MLISLALLQLTLEPIASGLDSPIHATFVSAQPEQLYIAEREGRIQVIDLSKPAVAPQLVLDISEQINTRSERGLLAIAFPPTAKNHHTLFAHYNDEDGVSYLSKFMFGNEKWTEEIIFLQEQPWANHNGGQICFGPDGALYLGLGDGGAANDPHNNGQNQESYLGGIIRFDLNQKIVEPELWHYGLRNPWRFSFDRKTNDLWIGDVGQNKWEEIDFAKANEKHLNFGWRWREGRHDFNVPDDAPTDWEKDVREPAFEYAQGGSPRSCSVTGGFVYRGKSLAKKWQGHYFFGDWASGIVWSGQPQLLKGNTVMTKVVSHKDLNLGAGLASFAEDASGELYLINMSKGLISRIKSGN